MKLSIIIPMYNAEPYIRKCLESCLDQDLPADDYEIIVVDDGSTDAGLSVAEEVAAGARREGKAAVRIFSQENAGQAVARNKALTRAAGEYVWFVDADDWVESRCLGRLFALASGFDILAFGAANYRISEGGLVVQDVFAYPENRDTTGREHFLRMNERIKVCPPFHLFRRRFLADHSLEFPAGIFHEDAQFTPEAVASASSVRMVTGTYYGRLIHTGSTMRSINPKRIRDLHAVIRNLQIFKQSRQMDAALVRAFDSYLANVFNQSNKLTLEFAQADPGQRHRLFRDQNLAVSRMPWLQEVLCNSLQLKYRLEGRLLRLFPGKAVQVFRFLLRFRPA